MTRKFEGKRKRGREKKDYMDVQLDKLVERKRHLTSGSGIVIKKRIVTGHNHLCPKFWTWHLEIKMPMKIGQNVITEYDLMFERIRENKLREFFFIFIILRSLLMQA